MPRRTKILATLGPATDAPGVLEEVLEAGANVVRINFSHGTPEEHLNRVKAVRNWAKSNDTYIGVLMDLQGPKIRISSFKEGKINLAIGDKFCLDSELDNEAGDNKSVGIAYKSLPKEVKSGDVLLLDDGRVVLQVEDTSDTCINTTVVQGGPLSNKKGINLKGGGLAAGALTDKDKEDIKIAAEGKQILLPYPFQEMAMMSGRQKSCLNKLVRKLASLLRLKELSLLMRKLFLISLKNLQGLWLPEVI